MQTTVQGLISERIQSHSYVLAWSLLPLSLAILSSQWDLYPVLPLSSVLLLALVQNIPEPLVFGSVVVSFYIMNIHLAFNPTRRGVSQQMWFLMLILTAACLLYFIWIWRDAVARQTTSVVLMFVAVNCAIAGFLWIACWLKRSSATRVEALALSAASYCWLLAFAFPYLGEGL